MAVPGSLQDLKSRNLYVSLVAEFLGTFFLVLIGCGACQTYDGNWIGISLAFGLAVATMAWCIGHVSGCHINTAITFGFLITRKISIVRALLYMVVQVIGAIVAAAVLKSLLNSQNALTMTLAKNLGTSSPAAANGVSAGQTFGIELLITFVLVFTVFATCDELRKDHGGSGALSIGLSLTLAHLFAAPLTGAGMNPARVFGPALISGVWKYHWAYWVGPLIGGALAAVMYDLLFAVNASTAKIRGCCTLKYDDSDYDNQGAKSGAEPEKDQNQSEIALNACKLDA